MKAIFGACQIEKMTETSVPKILQTSLTETEDTWLKLRFSLIQEQSVSASEHFLTEAIGLLHHQIPVSQSFITLWWVIATERVRRVLTIHPDFKNLPYNEQQILWRKNQRNATVIVVSRMDALPTGKDQFKNLLGMIDSPDKSLENQINDNVDLNALQVSYLKDPNLNLGKLDETTLRLFPKHFWIVLQ